MSQKKKQVPGGMSQPQLEERKPDSITVPAANTALALESPLLKKFFFGSILLMLIIFVTSGYNVGFHTDESDMNNYGKANVAYYTSGGKDTSCLGLLTDDDTRIETIFRYYGSGFEYLPVIFNKLTGLDKGANEFNSRHIFINIFGVLALLFSGLIAKKLGGWRAALFTVWLIFLTPTIFGLTLFDSKDIPFCAGYTAMLYLIINLLEELPNPTWRTTLLLMLAFAYTMSTRVAGLLLILTLGMFIVIYGISKTGMFKLILGNIKQIILKLSIIFFGGLILVVITWPFLLMNPVHNFFEALSVVKKFPMMIPLNFEGIYMSSLTVPAYYLPKSMLITIPIFATLAILTGILIAFLKKKEYDWRITTLILFTSIFPIVYAIVSNVVIYTLWRHFLFIYPGLCIIAGIGLNHIFSNLKQQRYRIALIVVCALGMLRPVMWSVNNFPYNYCYFNEFVGGYKKAYYEYETDYWKITMKNCLEWMMKNEPIMQSKDSITVGTDMPMFVQYYLKHHYKGAKVKVVLNDVPTRYGVPWTYCIFSKQFINPEYFEKFYPPKGSIFAEKIDGLTECVVLKDTARLDLLARKAYESRNSVAADSLLSLYLTRDAPDNVGLFGVMAFIKAQVRKNDEAFKYASLGLQYNISPISNYFAVSGIGLAYANQGQYDKAIEKLKEAINILPDNGLANNVLNAVLKIKAENQSANITNQQKK